MKKVKAVLIGSLALWFLLWVYKTQQRTNQQADAPNIHVTTGYLKTADLYLRHNWLNYGQPKEDEKNTTKDQKNTPKDQKIRTTFDPGTAMEAFYEQSYLKRDVAAFNQGSHDLFRIENGRIVGINPYIHNIVLPFTKLKKWEGNLTYRPLKRTLARLTGPNLSLDLQPAERMDRNPTLEEVILHDISHRDKTLKRFEAKGYNLYGGGYYFGKSFMMGDAIVFNNRDQNRILKASVNGVALPLGNWARLDTGDLLKLEWRDSKNRKNYTMLYSSITGDAPEIASYRIVNGKGRHLPKKLESPYMEELVRALNNVYRSKQAKAGTNPFDLALTLHQPLQEKVQAQLVAYCRALRGKKAKSRENPPFRGAVTVMDTKTGELLALASYPEPADLEDMEGTSRSRNRLLGNHNFSRLAIGSVAKIIWSAAILHTEPKLADLQIAGYAGGEFDQILGIEIEPPLTDHDSWGGTDQKIGFEEYIEHSSNKYAAVLLTLASGFEQGGFTGADEVPGLNTALGEDRFFLGKRPYQERPPLRFILTNTDKDRVRARTTSNMEVWPFIKAIDELFGVAITVKKRPSSDGRGDDLLDTSLWLPLLEYLYGKNSIPRNHPFYGVSPERENMAYNLVSQYRTQYLSMILGGGESTWTNIKLCEVFSRLVTGKKIETSLVKRISGVNQKITPNATFEELGMAGGARQRLLNAMTRVAKTGTARRLGTSLRALEQRLKEQGKKLGFYSKTGSPTNVTSLPTHTQKVMNKLIARGALKMGPKGKIHYRGKGAVKRHTRRTAGGTDYAQQLKNHRADAAILRASGLRAHSVVNLCHTYNQGRNRESGPFVIKNGKLVSFQRVQNVESIGAVYTFTMGIYDQAQQGTQGGTANIEDTQPEQALTVSIIIETQGESKIAVRFAKDLIEEVIWDALTQQP